MTEEEYNEIREVEDAEDYAHEFQFKRDGMVAFLDILGYKQIAETDSESVIQEVMGVLKQAQDDAVKLMSEIDLPEEPRFSFMGYDSEDIKLINISDSIILHDRFSDALLIGSNARESKELDDSFRIYRFILFCRKVWGALFERGLPPRGAISIGTFYWNHETMLAGRPIVEAYKTSESLSFSGLVLADGSLAAMHDRARPLFEKNYPAQMLFLRSRLPVPVKSSSGDGILPMDVVVPDFSFVPTGKMADYVRGRFEAYGKKVDSPRVQAIVKNTIDFLLGDPLRQ